MKSASNILWKGRKTFCGLPITFTKYELTENRLFVTTGFLNKEVDELLLYRILDIKYNISIINRIFGVGTITLYCADVCEGILKLVRIKKSRALRDMLSNYVEEERRKAGIQGKEIYGAVDEYVEHNGT